jgi:hypothetical protein
MIDSLTSLENIHLQVTENDAILIITTNSQNVGRITFMNRGASELLGLTQTYHANTKQIFDIMTSTIADGHAKLFKDLAENYEYKNSEILNTAGFVKKCKNNYIIPCTLSTQLYPYLMGDLRFICKITRLHNSKDYLVVHRDGTIEGITQNLADSLKLDLMSSSKLKLSNICKRFNDLKPMDCSYDSELKVHGIKNESNNQQECWNSLINMKEEILTFTNGPNELVCEASAQIESFYGFDYCQIELYIRDKDIRTTNRW